MSGTNSPLENPVSVFVLVAVLLGLFSVGSSLARTGSVSAWAIGVGFGLGWLVMYAGRFDALARVGRRVKARGRGVVPVVAVVLAGATFVLTSSLSLESWLLTNTSFGLLLGVATVVLVGP